jgi:hypothetical protein
VAKSFEVYTVPHPEAAADSGNGLTLLGEGGAVLGRVEWSAGQSTLVDGAGARITAMKLRGVHFERDGAQPRVVHYRYKTDDERGDLVDIQSAVGLRN